MPPSPSPRPRPRPEIMAIEAYVPGKSGAPGVAKVHKLSSNESPLGPSPNAIEAFRGEAGNLALYPDGSAHALRAAIAAHHGLDAEHIICGNGSDELIGLLAHVYLSPGDEGLYTQYGFLEYPIVTRAAGAVPVVAPEDRFTASVEGLLAKVTARTRMIFLANPNNPTGTYLPFKEVKRLQVAMPSDTLLVLDAAYAEYVQKNDYATGVELVSLMRKCSDAPHIFEDSWAGEFTSGLGVCARCRRGGAEPGARSLQRQRRGAGGWPCGDRR